MKRSNVDNSCFPYSEPMAIFYSLTTRNTKYNLMFITEQQLSWEIRNINTFNKCKPLSFPLPNLTSHDTPLYHSTSPRSKAPCMHPRTHVSDHKLETMTSVYIGLLSHSPIEHTLGMYLSLAPNSIVNWKDMVCYFCKRKKILWVEIISNTWGLKLIFFFPFWHLSSVHGGCTILF